MPYYFKEFRGGAYYSFNDSEEYGIWGGYIKRGSAEKQHRALLNNGHKLGDIFFSRDYP